eukprot:CAMPEP_0176473526 /NCGR_PEP_ID=MMETSP0127-20121128/42360_1 /TAXON_ID=938130 /ORGANISM="Platyophrya macrostoma, Strain WH" /LENGTH=668 /DNA_ID=CAMNT_0017868541 /DNA_START=21 /DNA_END=2027 /DNA_ORIENTATION=+
MSEFIAILDAGSQFGKVIDRKIRELHVETRILPLDSSPSDLQSDNSLKGVIISGGPNSVYSADAPSFNASLFDPSVFSKPILGICYGMQLMGLASGGVIQRKTVREDGQETIVCDVDSSLFVGLEPEQQVLLTHGDSLTHTGDDIRVIATSQNTGIIAAIQHKKHKWFGVQFHPEVDLSVNGVKILKNFLDLSECNFSFTMEDRESVAIRRIREHAGADNKILCLASGGVDSTVCAALLMKALGPDRVVCIHIDHGFMRLEESSQVISALADVGVKVHCINAAETFANATTTVPAKGGRQSYETAKLSDTISPEDKRQIIGNTFMRVCDEVVKSMSLDVDRLLLAQGTLRPDLIESGSHLASKKADAIKTHHNDTEVVRQLRSQGKIIEPLSEYHKDEVRELGRSLGLPEHLVMRQPFPGPGLAIRILCCDSPSTGSPYAETRNVIDRLMSLKNNVEAECHTQVGDAERVLENAAGVMRALKLHAVLLPILTVGVQGDGRTYSNAVAISSEAVLDTQEKWCQLLSLARILPQVAHGVNRVVFAFGSPITHHPTEVTPTTLTPAVIRRAQVADAVVGQVMTANGLLRKLSQVPVVLVPLGFEKGPLGHSVVIRTFLTNDFMTGVPATPGTEYLPFNALHDMISGLEKLDFLGRVLFDLTAKPPGTTEWE